MPDVWARSMPHDFSLVPPTSRGQPSIASVRASQTPRFLPVGLCVGFIAAETLRLRSRCNGRRASLLGRGEADAQSGSKPKASLITPVGSQAYKARQSNATHFCTTESDLRGLSARHYRALPEPRYFTKYQRRHRQSPRCSHRL